MLRLLIAVALTASLAGCKARPKEGEVRRIRDADLGVTCWIVTHSGSISCVKDAP